MQKWLPLFALLILFQLVLPGFAAEFSYDVAQSTAMARAPFLKPTIDAYLCRFSVEEDPAPALNEFAHLLSRYNNRLDPVAYYKELCARYNVGNADTIAAESLFSKSTLGDMDFVVDNSDSNCWHVSAAQSSSDQLILAVWEDERNGVDNPDIFGQFFDVNLTPVGNNFLVHTATGFVAQTSPSVAALSDGGFMVVWEDYRGQAALAYGRRFKADRTPDGAEFQIAVAANSQLKPVVTADLAGNFLVTWLEESQDGYNVFVRQFNNAKTPLTPAFMVNETMPVLRWFPAAATAAGGETLVVWEDKRDGNSNIYAQRLRADGSKRAGNFRVDNASSDSRQWEPAVVAGAGQFIVTWEDYRNSPSGIYAQWFDASLLADGANKRVDDFAVQSLKLRPSVALNASGESLFAWHDNRDDAGRHIYAQAFDATKTAAAVFTLAEKDAGFDQVLGKVLMNNRLLTFFWLQEAAGEEVRSVFANQLLWDNVPVELADFSVKVNDATITCAWTTLSESNNLGFAVERSEDGIDFTQIGFVKGNGSTNNARHYTFVDANPPAGTLYYRLKQIDFDGSASYSTVEKISSNMPATLTLVSNYPNPFNPTTTISYQMPENGRVEVGVYDMTGHLIAALFQGEQAAGNYELTWTGVDKSGRACGSGIYLCRIKAGEKTDVLKMTLIK